MRHDQCSEPCSADCGAVLTDRNRYFTGKYLTARDFQGEQDFMLSRMRLHNRLLHGWGIVCGLEVMPHPDERCRDQYVVVCPGIAIDCRGREIVVERRTLVPLRRSEERAEGREHNGCGCGAAAHGDAAERPKQTTEPLTGEYFLCLSYEEEKIEYIPALYHEGTCDAKHLEANRVREGACLRLCPRDEVGPDCWVVPSYLQAHPDTSATAGQQTAEQAAQQEQTPPSTSKSAPSTGDRPHRRPCPDDCDGPCCGSTGCLNPVCPCGQMVPLALLTFPADGSKAPTIDVEGRRDIALSPSRLTQIVETSWAHGAEIPLAELHDGDKMARRLSVRFSRPLHGPTGDRTGAIARNGVLEQTFWVAYTDADDNLTFFRPQSLTLEEGGRLAVFTLPDLPKWFGNRSELVNSTILITLKCDFILDCHRMPVDGEHLRGRLPSGDGRAGGLFESWFRVVD